MDYYSIPFDYHTNNYLENYNGYIKKRLGKNRYINWVNFLYFIKEENDRWFNKLFEYSNKQVSFNFNTKKTEIFNFRENMSYINKVDEADINETCIYYYYFLSLTFVFLK